MSDNLNTDINDYTPEELLELLGFDGADDPSIELIMIKLNKVISKYKSENNTALVQFYTKAKSILKDFMDKNTINSGVNPIILKNKPDIQNVLPVDINIGTVNPNLIQTTVRYFIIDSKHRQNIIPYSCDPNSLTSSTKFICSLTSGLKNTTKLTINTICLPRAWYTFDDFTGNTYFQIDGSGGLHNIHITEGDYDPSGIVKELNEKITNIGLTDITVSLVENILTPIIQFSNANTTDSYTINFYKLDNSLTYDISCNNTTITIDKYNRNLGYNLGYRITDTSNYSDLKITIPKSGTVKASAPLDIAGTQYIRLVLDDYNNNYVNNTEIGIDSTTNTSNTVNTTTDMPSYYGKVLQDILCVDASNENIYLPTFPRKLTQSQIYSINEINSQKQKKSSRLEQYTNPQTLAIAHVPNIILNKDTRGMSYKLQLSTEHCTKRIYFGPVAITKMQISLYDDKGYILNLHGQDWSFTMTAEDLYGQ